MTASVTLLIESLHEIHPKLRSCRLVETRRTYRSSLRAEQARTTRRAIVEAGPGLFVERGFGAPRWTPSRSVAA